MRVRECEKCGSGIPIVQKVSEKGDSYQVMCSNFSCGYTSNITKSEKEAIQDWNLKNIQLAV